MSTATVFVPRIVVLVGPTASGKTALSLELAERFNAEIVSADSMQIYRGMDIGTAKPGRDKRALVPHHLIDIVDPDESYNAARYQQDADRVIRSIEADGRMPLIVGGTGLYIKTLLHGIFADSSVRQPCRSRQRLQDQGRLGGNPYARLAAVDPEAARRIHPNDSVRAQRALEVFLTTGRSITALQAEHGFLENRYRALLVGLRVEREELHRRIDARVDRMIAADWLEETRALLRKGYAADLPAMMGLGYRQMVRVVNGELSPAEARERIKRDTRRYAKRQITWFQNQEKTEWVEAPGAEETIRDAIQRFLDRV